MEDLSKFESDQWEAADSLRANSKLTSSDSFMPVLGVIILRHAALAGKIQDNFEQLGT
jgi:type I restriction enzyme M protein